ALQPMTIPDSAELTIWVRIDGDAPPKAISVELVSQRATHRALWGEGGVIGGTKTDKSWMGDVPKAGEWTQLTIPADTLDLKAGDVIRSVALTQFGGVCWWDGLRVAGTISPATDVRSSFLAWRKQRTGQDTPGVPAEFAAVLKQGPEAKEGQPQPGEELLTKLRNWYLAWISRPSNA